MKTIRIAFDIDGTLRCNCQEDCEEENYRICQLVTLLGSFKNIELHAWSGGGKAYAWRFVRKYGLDGYIPEKRCHSKLEHTAIPKMDIAVDDQHEFNLAHLNLIVREK